MKKPVQFVSLLSVVALVAAGACLVTRFVVPTMRHPNPEEAHYWIHKQLGITPHLPKK